MGGPAPRRSRCAWWRGARAASTRIVVNGESAKGNIWLQSELAVCGRPVGPAEYERGAPTSVLPKSASLLLPEGSSPDTGIRLAERVRPSPEQTSAQKGCARLELLLESLVRYVNPPGPVLLVNFTGYVEELGAAVARIPRFSLFACLCKFLSAEALNLRIKGSLQGEGGGFSFADKLFYLSMHTLDNDQYGRCRIAREILDAWLDKKIAFDGNAYDDSEVNLTEQDGAFVNVRSFAGRNFVPSRAPSTSDLWTA